MNYREALAWLYGTQRFGIKLGLENIERILRELGLPAPNDRIIHVAGTNGKGSVCAMIDAIGRAAGVRTGLFTSPHLITFRERIQVDGEPISEGDVARGLTSLRAQMADYDPHPTFFEITTALALQYFTERTVDLIILETGLGGRLDATNAVTPIVSVITSISYDHEQWLGHTVAEIAAEKAGIIKPRIPAVSAPQLPEAEAVLRARAAECGAPLEFISANHSHAISLPGEHQKQNAALAIAALRAAKIDAADSAIAAGLTNVHWPARFQRWNDRIVIDGAHNPAGARVLAATWREHFGNEKAALIFGVLRDKDAAAVYRELAPIVGSVVLPHFRGERPLLPAELAAVVASISPHTPCVLTDSVAAALDEAGNASFPILIAGSLHLAGEALAHLRGEPAAFEECSQ